MNVTHDGAAMTFQKKKKKKKRGSDADCHHFFSTTLPLSYGIEGFSRSGKRKRRGSESSRGDR